MIFFKRKPKIEELGVKAIVRTNYPQVFAYFYESLGYETDVLEKGGQTYLVVWKRGEKEKLLEKLKKMI